MSKSGDKKFHKDIRTESPLILEKLTSNNSKIETSLEISNTDTSKTLLIYLINLRTLQ